MSDDHTVGADDAADSADYPTGGVDYPTRGVEYPTGSAEYTVALDEQGVVRLIWTAGVDISEDAAQSAMAAVNRVCAGVERPMLVDMASTASVSRQARGVFAQPCSAGIIALLGRSPVDRVIANFVLGISKLPGPTRYFTVEAQALEWLKGKHEQR